MYSKPHDQVMKEAGVASYNSKSHTRLAQEIGTRGSQCLHYNIYIILYIYIYMPLCKHSAWLQYGLGLADERLLRLRKMA